MTRAAAAIAMTAPLAADAGRPGEGVGVGRGGVIVVVAVLVGHGVMVGSWVGVPVGWVAVGVKGARMMIDCPG